MAQITVIGAGYVGLVTGGCFAELGHKVTCVETLQERIECLNRGDLPVHEPGLDDIWTAHMKSGALLVTDDYEAALRDSDFAFICVGSPSLPDGSADLHQVMSAAASISASAPDGVIVVLKSTVPVGTATRVQEVLDAGRGDGARIPVVSNPEFLRESQAVTDFLDPDRVIVGSEDAKASQAVASLYGGLDERIVFCDNATAEMIKYASNAFLATKISFINEIAGLCDGYGIDVARVSKAVGMDHRIGPHFLGAGLGWGGSCLPKDTRALMAMAQDRNVDVPLLAGVVSVNARQPVAVVDRLTAALGRLDSRAVGVWGLTFKPGTDDLRDSPALRVAELLLKAGCTVKVYDPMVSPEGPPPIEGVQYCTDAYEACRETDAVVIATAWEEFLSVDLPRVREEMRGRVFFDARGAFDPGLMTSLGFRYLGLGRSPKPASEGPRLGDGRAEGSLALTAHSATDD